MTLEQEAENILLEIEDGKYEHLRRGPLPARAFHFAPVLAYLSRALYDRQLPNRQEVLKTAIARAHDYFEQPVPASHVPDAFLVHSMTDVADSTLKNALTNCTVVATNLAREANFFLDVSSHCPKGSDLAYAITALLSALVGGQKPQSLPETTIKGCCGAFSHAFDYAVASTHTPGGIFSLEERFLPQDDSVERLQRAFTGYQPIERPNLLFCRTKEKSIIAALRGEKLGYGRFD